MGMPIALIDRRVHELLMNSLDPILPSFLVLATLTVIGSSGTIPAQGVVPFARSAACGAQILQKGLD